MAFVSRRKVIPVLSGFEKFYSNIYHFFRAKQYLHEYTNVNVYDIGNKTNIILIAPGTGVRVQIPQHLCRCLGKEGTMAPNVQKLLSTTPEKVREQKNIIRRFYFAVGGYVFA